MICRFNLVKWYNPVSGISTCTPVICTSDASICAIQSVTSDAVGEARLPSIMPFNWSAINSNTLLCK